MDVLTALRQATAQRHAVLDSRTPLAAPAPDLRAYHDHLRLLEAWLAPIQRWLEQPGEAALPPLPPLPLSPPPASALARRDYLALIRADLAHPSLAAMPRSTLTVDAEWPAHASEAYRWGVAYVIEGSQLGGAVLYKRLAQRLAPHPLDYLRGAGSPGPRWQQFLGAMRASVTTAAQIDDACRGARQAFDSLIALVDDVSSWSEEPAGRP